MIITGTRSTKVWKWNSVGVGVEHDLPCCRSLPHSCGRSDVCEGGRGEGMLVVEDAREEEEGYYICTAEVQGVTSAAVCKVTVGGE